MTDDWRIGQSAHVFPRDIDVENACRQCGIDPVYDRAYIGVVLDALCRKPLPEQWRVYVTVEEGDPYFVKLEHGNELECTWENPNLEAAREEIDRIQAAKALEHRARASKALGGDAKGSTLELDPDKQESQRQAFKARLVRKTLQDAHSHFVSTYGDPELDDIEPNPDQPGFFDVTPEQVKEYAENVLHLSLPEEAPLIWVARLALTAPLPPDWDELLLQDGESPRYRHKCWMEHGFPEETVSHHPAQSYFRALVESGREELELLNMEGALDEEMEAAFRRGILMFRNEANGLVYDYDFAIGTALEIKDKTVLERYTTMDTTELSNQQETNATKPTLDATELDALIQSQNMDLIWNQVSERIPEEDLRCFAKALGVKLRGPRTMFLDEIANVLLGPLPENWIRRRDPLGREHYCVDIPRVVFDSSSCNASTYERIKELARIEQETGYRIPHWVSHALEAKQSVRLFSLYSTSLHPCTMSMKLRVDKAREEKARTAKLLRLRERQEKSMRQVTSRLYHSRLDRKSKRSPSRLDPSRQAYDYYVNLYGDPMSTIVTRSVEKPPVLETVLERAKLLDIDHVSEPHLLWIAHARTCAPLPPNWENQPGSVNYIHSPTEFESMQHPADSFFLAVTTQERKASVSDCRHPWIDLVDQHGKRFRYNTITKERSYAASRLPGMTTVHSCVPLNLVSIDTALQSRIGIVEKGAFGTKHESEKTRITTHEAKAHCNGTKEQIMFPELSSSMGFPIILQCAPPTHHRKHRDRSTDGKPRHSCSFPSIGYDDEKFKKKLSNPPALISHGPKLRRLREFLERLHMERCDDGVFPYGDLGS